MSSFPGAMFADNGVSLDPAIPNLTRDKLAEYPHRFLVARERLAPIARAWLLSDDATFAAIPAERRALVTNHHVFGYLADRFDFDVVGAVIPGGTTLAAPSASDLADLVDAVETTGVPTVFAESSSPDRLVQALASEADVHVDVVELFTESLTAADGDASDYLTMMRVDTERIATGLSP